MQQGHAGEIVAGTELNAVCPGGTLFEQAPGLAARARQLGGDEQFNRIAELDRCRIVVAGTSSRTTSSAATEAAVGSPPKSTSAAASAASAAALPMNELGQLASERPLGEPALRCAAMLGEDRFELLDGAEAEAQQSLGDVSVVGLQPVLAELVRARAFSRRATRRCPSTCRTSGHRCAAATATSARARSHPTCAGSGRCQR